MIEWIFRELSALDRHDHSVGLAYPAWPGFANRGNRSSPGLVVLLLGSRSLAKTQAVAGLKFSLLPSEMQH